MALGLLIQFGWRGEYIPLPQYEAESDPAFEVENIATRVAGSYYVHRTETNLRRIATHRGQYIGVGATPQDEIDDAVRQASVWYRIANEGKSNVLVFQWFAGVGQQIHPTQAITLAEYAYVTARLKKPVLTSNYGSNFQEVELSFEIFDTWIFSGSLPSPPL